MKNSFLFQFKRTQFPKWNILLVILLLNLFALPGFSQNKKQEELINQFDTFKKGFEQQHQKFIDKNDSIFVQFLRASWKKVSLLKGDIRSTTKPSQQPVQADTSLKSLELKFDTSAISLKDVPLSLIHI
jgi:hypothetical protein